MGTATIVLAGEPAPGTPLVAELPDDVVEFEGNTRHSCCTPDVVVAAQNVERLPNIILITFDS